MRRYFLAILVLPLLFWGLGNFDVAAREHFVSESGRKQILIAQAEDESELGEGEESEDGTSGEVIIPIDGDSWLEQVFGPDGLQLNILKPLAIWDMEGTAGIWSIFAMVVGLVEPVLFISFLFAVAIGVIKWISSAGDTTKIQSARKWVGNAVVGLLAVIFVFIGSNIVAWLFGAGSIFSLAQNLAVCGGQVQYEAEREQCGGAGSNCECSCEGGSWVCIEAESE